MSLRSKGNSRDGQSNKTNKSNKSNKESRFSKDRDSRRSGSSSGTDKRKSEGRPFDKEKRERRPSSSSSERFPDHKTKNESGRKPFNREGSPKRSDKPFVRREKKEGELRHRKTNKVSSSPAKNDKTDNTIRLNRYIANAGVCSRRKADELIDAGVITINGEVVTTLGTKVDPAKDDVRYNGERLKREKMVYVLLNKPKDYITTTDDPQERRTVMHLIEKATQERVYPVGRLDRNTTGLLLLTNDGSLAEKLSHPRNNVTKIYQVELDKSLTQGDLNKIRFGLELEDGLIKPDDVNYVQGASKREVGIQIHSGKNRIVRRIFESLGYTVVKLDRAIYANLTKKDLPRGRWRHLEEREVIQLKHFMK